MAFLNKIYYGWWITLALFIAGLLAFGGGVYAFTLFLPSLETEFGWGRAVTGGAVSVLWLSAPLLPLIGYLVDRFGARLLVGTGLLITGVLYMLMFFVQAAWQLYAIRIIMGIGKLLVLVSTTTSAARWFLTHQGVATGAMLAGTHLGGFLLAPATQYFIDTAGWRYAALMLGITVLVVGLPPVIWMMRWNKPQELGLLPDGINAAEQSKSALDNKADEAPAQYGVTIKQALKMPAFWIIGVLELIYYYGMSAVLFQQTSLFTDLDIDSGVIARIVGAFAAIAMIACPLSGLVVDRMGGRRSLILFFALQAFAVICLLLFKNQNDWYLLYTFVILFGIHLGATDVGFCVLLREQFGNRYYGAIFGTSYLFIVSMLIGGSVISGFVYDKTGSYLGGFLPIVIGAFFAIIVLNIFLKTPSWKLSEHKPDLLDKAGSNP